MCAHTQPSLFSEPFPSFGLQCPSLFKNFLIGAGGGGGEVGGKRERERERESHYNENRKT